jgi:hypothetical protein
MSTVTILGNEAAIKNICGLNANDPFLYIGIGTGTTPEASNQTALVSEQTGNGLERALATCEYLTPFKIRWSHTFLVTNSTTVAEFGIFNGSTAGTGDMFLREALSEAVSVYTGDEIEVIITHTMKT